MSLSKGAIAGIAVSSAIIVFNVTIMLYLWIKRRRTHSRFRNQKARYAFKSTSNSAGGSKAGVSGPQSTSTKGMDRSRGAQDSLAYITPYYSPEPTHHHYSHRGSSWGGESGSSGGDSGGWVEQNAGGDGGVGDGGGGDGGNGDGDGGGDGGDDGGGDGGGGD
ncbi:hypothetical protein GYMLUDRAFT_776142 [Collybiopsis luxurians FD-317 M1]|uniref:Uncharacterized protein n=1 Tax=Collybiopsis luxurians FD-317 M1 TaxID=944289 RepID=A0A0D0BP84_9AGAR|nr:hypothetical protein GYMLUDRAFT_776142 [Collybiopsis luxurians FD-317 M1]